MTLRDKVLRAWRDPSTERRDEPDVVARLGTLVELANLVSSTLDPRVALDFVAEAAFRLLDGAPALVLLAEGEGQTLAVRAAHGVGRPALRAQDRFRPGEGLAGWVFLRREALVLNDVLADPRTLNRQWIVAEGLRAFAGVPLLLRDRCLGVLCSMRPGERPFRPADVDLLAAFAAHKDEVTAGYVAVKKRD